MAVMSEVVLSIPVQGEQKQPRQELPDVLVHSPVAEQAVVSGVVHEDRQRVKTDTDQHHRKKVGERVSDGLGEPDGQDDHSRVQEKVAKPTPRVDSRQLRNQVRGNSGQAAGAPEFIGLARGRRNARQAARGHHGLQAAAELRGAGERTSHRGIG
jgi:hypothetical protein